MKSVKRVLILVNRKAGLFWSFNSMREAIDRHWESTGLDIKYQFCQNAEDGSIKTQRALDQHIDTILVAGGDGTVNTVGKVVAGTEVSIGVIPSGSGNGFARHFGIPLAVDQAVRSLASAEVKRIDVGVMNDIPFFITCSMAWDASLVRSFEKSQVRGIFPYVFAGVNEFFQYQPQPFYVTLDGDRKRTFKNPMVFTVANLTQFGGGAKIAPQARPDDGKLELVAALRQDIPRLIGNIGRLFNGSVNSIPEVISDRFTEMRVERQKPGPVQIDGELIEAEKDILIKVRPNALKVLVPKGRE